MANGSAGCQFWKRPGRHDFWNCSCSLIRSSCVCETVSICGAEANEFGRHGLSCKKSKGSHARHAVLNETIHRALSTAKVVGELEPARMDWEDGKRPDGATYNRWKNGNLLLRGVTVVDTFAVSYIPQTSKIKGAAASRAETRKIEKYANFLDRYIFQPIGLRQPELWDHVQLHLCGDSETFREHIGNPKTIQFF